MTTTHVDLNKTPEAVVYKHAFFFCPKCGSVAETTKEPCESKECETGPNSSVFLQMKCKNCRLTAGWTHWEVH